MVRAVEPWEPAALALAGFAAGAVNAVAGGGSLISFPALLLVGYPAKAANVTNTVALWPGYASGSWAYRQELRRQGGRIVRLLPVSLAGALLGSVLLLSTPADTFEAMVPYLIYFATVTLLFQEQLARFAERRRLRARHAHHLPVAVHLAVLALAVYGAYFGAGLGIMLLAVLLVLLPDDIHHANALKGLLSAIVNSVAVVWFLLFGPVRLAAAAATAAGALLGGYVGVGLARRLGPRRLRLAVAAYGVLAGTVYLLR